MNNTTEQTEQPRPEKGQVIKIDKVHYGVIRALCAIQTMNRAHSDFLESTRASVIELGERISAMNGDDKNAEKLAANALKELKDGIAYIGAKKGLDHTLHDALWNTIYDFYPEVKQGKWTLSISKFTLTCLSPDDPKPGLISFIQDILQARHSDLPEEKQDELETDPPAHRAWVKDIIDELVAKGEIDADDAEAIDIK